MKYNKFVLTVLLLSIISWSCKQHEEARRPLSHSSGSFMKKSAERNKKLIAGEENQIKTLMKDNSSTNYIASAKGYWYWYENKNSLDTLTPKKGDVSFFDYELKDLKGSVIYSQVELRPQTYLVDKQNIMMGLRDGIKLMHKNEKIHFLFPSHLGYGYHGDNKKIGINQPLICTVTLRNFLPEADYRKEIELKKAALLKEQIKTQKKDTLTL
jgi:gliding motility-associated peptidyl-prolyl isomerase